jgi:hypothetical protein
MSDRVCLLELRVPGISTPYRWQSSQLADYAYGGNLWQFAPFEIRQQPEQSLELVAENAQIWIRNNSIVQSLIDTYDGLRRSIVMVLVIDPTGEMPSDIMRTQVASSSPIGGYQAFNLSTPTTALAGAAVNRFFNKADFPELPTKRAAL